MAVAADYDGDGKADPAIYGESNGRWFLLLSSLNYSFLITLESTLGGTGYVPVPADYDGDGLADPAVKLENGNQWIVMFSSSAEGGQGFGPPSKPPRMAAGSFSSIRGPSADPPTGGAQETWPPSPREPS